MNNLDRQKNNLEPTSNASDGTPLKAIWVALPFAAATPGVVTYVVTQSMTYSTVVVVFTMACLLLAGALVNLR